ARARARALHDDVTLVGAAVENLGGVLELAVGHLAPGPVGPGEVAAQHPAVGQPLVEGDGRALVLLLAVTVGEEAAAAGGDARTELVPGDRPRRAVGKRRVQGHPL